MCEEVNMTKNLVKIYRKSLVDSIGTQIINDKYSETRQKEARNIPYPFPLFTVDFITRNIKFGRILEIGFARRVGLLYSLIPG